MKTKPPPPEELNLAHLPIRHVIMSRGRASRVVTHWLVPHATLVVSKDEAEAYAGVGYGLSLVTIPSELRGISPVRNWIVRRFEQEVVVMYDDDVSACRTLAGLLNRGLSPVEAEAMVENIAWSAKGAGARLFGWNQRPDPRVLQRNDPFSVVHWCGGLPGVVGKAARWDELLRFKRDIDCCLAELLVNRILWHESRFGFLQAREKNLGGNSGFRSPERIEAEKRYLKSKWKAHIASSEYQSQDQVRVQVERRQKVDL